MAESPLLLNISPQTHELYIYKYTHKAKKQGSLQAKIDLYIPSDLSGLKKSTTPVKKVIYIPDLKC